MSQPVIEREEVVALLLNGSDIVAALARIERLLREDEPRDLAERGQAKLDAKTSQP